MTDAARGPVRRALPLALLAAAALVPLFWPGDVPFINDEPLLIANAVRANAEARLAPQGLLGTFGFTYGPLPTWCYQALAATTHDLVTVAALHAALLAGSTAAALWWLSRSLGLWPWFAAVPLLSPYFWFYARVLWDNPFLIPLGALALAGYAAHLASGSSRGLRVTIAALGAMPLVHLMSLALILPLGGHLLVCRWRSLWAHRVSVIVIAAAMLVAGWPYWTYLAGAQAPDAGGAALPGGWLSPLFGGRLLSARGLAYFYGADVADVTPIPALSAVSSLAYVLVWAGMLVAASLAWMAWRRRDWTPRAHVSVIALGALIGQAVIAGVSARFEHPHYLNGIWIGLVLLSWLAVDRLAHAPRAVRSIAPIVTSVLAVSLAGTVIALALHLHRWSGTRETYGPTLANQQEVARVLAGCTPDTPLEIEVAHYLRFPHTIEVLRSIARAPTPPARAHEIRIRYRSSDPRSGAIAAIVR